MDLDEQYRLAERMVEILREPQSPPSPFVEETLGLIHGTLRRVWHPNPRYMEKDQPVGHWSTEVRK